MNFFSDFTDEELIHIFEHGNTMTSNDIEYEYALSCGYMDHGGDHDPIEEAQDLGFLDDFDDELMEEINKRGLIWGRG